MVFYYKIKRNMSFIVKNTTDFNVLDLICPHACRGCGRLGELLCECCKNNLIISKRCDVELMDSQVLAYGWRDGLLEEMVKEYKYAPVRGMGRVLAELMVEILPEGEVVIVPLPTVQKHVRERGFDHMWHLGRILAKKRGLSCVKMLERASNTVQVGANASKRKKQAKTAYKVSKVIDSKATYVLIDDVWTTGASMEAAIGVMKKAGAKKILGRVLLAGK